MTQAAHPWSFFQVVASQMDGAFDDCVMYSRFVPVFLRQVDPGVLQVMSYSPGHAGSSTTALSHRNTTRKEKTNGKAVYTPRPDKRCHA